jgi:hypothetical protein
MSFSYIRPKLINKIDSRVLTSDPQLYRLSLLVVLTGQLTSEATPLAECHNKYVTLIRRKLQSTASKEEGACRGEERLRDVFSSLEDLSRVSRILTSVTSRPPRPQTASRVKK